MAEIEFVLDGDRVVAAEGESILQASLRHGVEVPHLCYQPGLRADGNCRACLVEIEGERQLAPSCCRVPENGMVVSTANDRVRQVQRLVLELLCADVDAAAGTARGDSELEHWRQRLELGQPRFIGRANPAPDGSNPTIAVDLAACIQCTRCVRACRETQVNDVIGLAGRGESTRIVFDLDDPMGASSCVSCGECVEACPTGALLPAGQPEPASEQVDSLCPYCGVGCQLTFNVRAGRIQSVAGRDGPANHGRLCVKGRFGFDYVHHPHRLTRPLVRREGVAKSAEVLPRERFHEVFREAEWDEALDLAAAGLARIRDTSGADALAGFGSAKGSNEEAYLFQKLVRTGFGTNNVDHCTRLCHASSVTALLEGIGSGAVSNPVRDVVEADVVVVIGARPTVNHPVAATFIKNAVQAGSRLILIEPHRSELARHASWHLQLEPATDVALLNAMLHVIVTEDLLDHDFIAARTEGFDLLRETVLQYAPERVGGLCGIDPDLIRDAARAYAGATNAMIFWGMGIAQHVHGTDNARCLIALAMLTGQIGRPGTGLHPLRGQNNVQGASDMGLIPMVYPDYRPVGDAAARQAFESLWRHRLSERPGLTVVEIIDAIHREDIRGMYIMGENPAMSDPDLNHTRAALARLEHLVVQDIFPTETAGFADVILPASAFPEKTGTFTNTDRLVQLARVAVAPPGSARQDLWIVQQMANRLGLEWDAADAAGVFEEIREAVPSMAGITWQRLQQEGAVTQPLRVEGDPGEPVLFGEAFPTATGRARLVPAEYAPADELPDDEYPFVLMTGRQLEHWHTGAMTRAAKMLDALEPGPTVYLAPEDIAALGLEAGSPVVVESRRGRLVAPARADAGLRPRHVFVPFAYREAAANLLTNPRLDPQAKIPEFKYCAVRVSAA